MRVVSALILGWSGVGVVPALAGPTQPTTAVLFVAPGGSDANNTCATATSPCASIQKAVDQAANRDFILVAAGTYNTAGGCPGPSSQVVCITGKYVYILGGYTTSFVFGTGDPIANPTIIDGNGVRRGVRVSGPGAGLWMEGFTIQNGYVKGGSSGADALTYAFGGGLYALTLSNSLVLQHMVFSNNTASGGDTSQAYGGYGAGGAVAIASVAGQSQLVDITFAGNHASGGSGATRGGDGFGGALYTDSSISGNLLSFTNNLAQGGGTSGAGVYQGRYADGLGGAVGCAVGSMCTLQNTSARNNTARGGQALNGQGGGAFGGAFFTEQGTLSLTDATLNGNLAEGGAGINSDWDGGLAEGGGIQSANSNVTLNRVTAISNTARGGNGTSHTGSANGGGAAFTGFTSASTMVSILNSVFADNRAEPGLLGASPRGGGGALWLQIPATNITHSTFAGNSVGGANNALYGSAILVDKDSVPGSLAVNINYSIFSDHLNGFVSIFTLAGPLTVNLKRNLFANSITDFYANTNVTINNTNPLNVTSVHYVSPGAPNYNYDISASSPAIDAATGSTTPVDIHDQPRTIPDIGADEYILMPNHTYVPMIIR